MNNFLKYIFYSFAILFIIRFIWIKMPLEIKYYVQIKQGNEFVKNINEFKRKNGKLPNENNWMLLSKLNPIKPYETFYPEYRIIDAQNFCLTFIEGFDPPYLQYNTRSKTWEKK